MLVTIITAVCNGSKTISKAIQSVLDQTYDEIEYIIIDALSTDNTLEVALEFIPLFNSSTKSLKVISEADLGLYDALNKGAKLANGELIGQINADDWYEIDAVEQMVRLYNTEHYDAAWGSSRIHGKIEFVKYAKIGRLWTSSGWCHPSCFSKKSILLEHPYPLESIHDDFDYITNLYLLKKKLVVTRAVISNFSMGKGGMSTKKGIREMINRINCTYAIYKKYNMSKLYYIYRVIYELTKSIVS